MSWKLKRLDRLVSRSERRLASVWFNRDMEALRLWGIDHSREGVAQHSDLMKRLTDGR